MKQLLGCSIIFEGNTHTYTRLHKHTRNHTLTKMSSNRLLVQCNTWRVQSVTLFLVKLLLTDFELGKKLLFEPSTSYQYRLCGPGAWLGARDAIMGQIQRTYYPLTDGRYVFRQQQGLALWKPLLLLAFVAVILSKWLLL